MCIDGIKVNLTEGDIKEAINWGVKNKDSFWDVLKSYMFGKWGFSEEYGVVFTKTFYLACIGAMAARKYKSPDEVDIGAVLLDDNLHIMINTYGSKANFHKDYHIILKQDERVIHSTKTESKKEADPTIGFLSIPYYRSSVTGFFHYSEIDLRIKTRIILCKGQTQSGFEVDFSRYK
jgi:hypothetical protein